MVAYIIGAALAAGHSYDDLESTPWRALQWMVAIQEGRR